MTASAGYLTPIPLTVAPGQLVTLFVPGFGNEVSGIAKAPVGSLPTALAGISAVFRQGSDQPVPIFEVQPIKSCTAFAPPANSCGSELYPLENKSLPDEQAALSAAPINSGRLVLDRYRCKCFLSVNADAPVTSRTSVG